MSVSSSSLSPSLSRKMFNKPWQLVVCVGFLVAVLAVQQTYAECNVCQKNQVACINSTSFYLCFGESEPQRDVLYHCMDGFECTSYDAICLQANEARKPSCGDTSLCGRCDANANHLFACLSRTTFQWCYGAARPIGQMGYCPEGMVCDASSDNVCVSESEPGVQVTCDLVAGDPVTESSTSTVTEESSTSTVTTESTKAPADSTTEPSVETQLTPSQVCEQHREVGLFSTIPADPACKSYIYCTYRNGVIEGTVHSCSDGTWFQAEMERCSLTKPSSCG